MTPLQINKLRELAHRSGPCVTIFLPAYRPGDQALHSTAALLRTFIQGAAKSLETSRTDFLLEPVRAMAADPRTDEGCHWARALFVAPGVFETIYLREKVASKSYTSDRFHILPLLDELSLPREFYILKISRKHAGLFRVQFSVESLGMPGNLPDNLDDFLNLDKPDHDRENRSSAGPGANRRIRFGTGSERETSPDASAYYRALDRAMREVKPKGPLLLAGVEEETTLYQDLAANGDLFEGTLPDSAPDQERIEQGYSVLRKAAVERGLKALAEAENRLAPTRFSTDLKAIATAAAEGRVLRLFVRCGADEEEINTAAVETIRHAGEAAILPAEKMGTPLAAALRY